jgi:hypothetical protein
MIFLSKLKRAVTLFSPIFPRGTINEKKAAPNKSAQPFINLQAKRQP